jgi:hypothetical protein
MSATHFVLVLEIEVDVDHLGAPLLASLPQFGRLLVQSRQPIFVKKKAIGSHRVKTCFESTWTMD